MAELPKTLPPDVAQALARGNVIEAIRLLRTKHGVGLAEARQFLESLQKQAQAAKAKAQAGAGAHAGAATHAGAHAHPHFPAHHQKPHTAATLHTDPHLSPGEVPNTTSGALFAAVVIAVLFVLGVAFYL